MSFTANSVVDAISKFSSSIEAERSEGARLTAAFQDSPEAWNISLQLLDHHEMYVKFFGGQTLSKKVKAEWASLQPNQRRALLSTLFTAMEKACPLSKRVRNQVALAVVYAALYSGNEWPTMMEDIVKWSQAANGRASGLLSILIMLPLECTSLLGQQSGTVMNILHDKTTAVLKLMFGWLQPSVPAEVKDEVIQAINSWASMSEESTPLLSTEYMPILWKCVDELKEQPTAKMAGAVSTLVCNIMLYASVERTPVFVRQLGSKLVELIPLVKSLSEAYQSAGEEAVFLSMQRVCSMFVAFVEEFSRCLVKMERFQPKEPPVAALPERHAIMEMLIMISTHPEPRMSAQSFVAWSEFCLLNFKQSGIARGQAPKGAEEAAIEVRQWCSQSTQVTLTQHMAMLRAEDDDQYDDEEWNDWVSQSREHMLHLYSVLGPYYLQYVASKLGGVIAQGPTGDPQWVYEMNTYLWALNAVHNDRTIPRKFGQGLLHLFSNLLALPPPSTNASTHDIIQQLYSFIRKYAPVFAVGYPNPLFREHSTKPEKSEGPKARPPPELSNPLQNTLHYLCQYGILPAAEGAPFPAEALTAAGALAHVTRENGHLVTHLLNPLAVMLQPVMVREDGWHPEDFTQWKDRDPGTSTPHSIRQRCIESLLWIALHEPLPVLLQLCWHYLGPLLAQLKAPLASLSDPSMALLVVQRNLAVLGMSINVLHELRDPRDGVTPHVMITVATQIVAAIGHLLSQPDSLLKVPQGAVKEAHYAKVVTEICIIYQRCVRSLRVNRKPRQGADQFPIEPVVSQLLGLLQSFPMACVVKTIGHYMAHFRVSNMPTEEYPTHLFTGVSSVILPKLDCEMPASALAEDTIRQYFEFATQVHTSYPLLIYQMPEDQSQGYRAPPVLHALVSVCLRIILSTAPSNVHRSAISMLKRLVRETRSGRIITQRYKTITRVYMQAVGVHLLKVLVEAIGGGAPRTLVEYLAPILFDYSLHWRDLFKPQLTQVLSQPGFPSPHCTEEVLKIYMARVFVSRRRNKFIAVTEAFAAEARGIRAFKR